MLSNVDTIADEILKLPTYENIEKIYNSNKRITIDNLSKAIYEKCNESKNFELFNRIQDKLQFIRMIDNNRRCGV